VDFGAHLPLMDFGNHPYTLEHLTTYTKAAAELGFAAVAVNDHLVFSVPWLDGPVALAAIMEHSARMTLATTVALVVVRGPVTVAKSLGAIDRLSGGRLVVAVGPGSSPDDYAAVGIDFSERWPRFDEAIGALRALWRSDGEPFVGRFYSTDGVRLEPRPSQPEGPPIWVGSWGSAAGLRRVARLADGWLASAYNTTPELFAGAWSALGAELTERGRSATHFPNALATMWCYITDDAAEAERVLAERVVPTVHRPEADLRERLPIGSPEAFAEKLSAFAQAGVQRVFIWPVADEVDQLERFWNEVRPLVASE
jgi:alkanesulfonate monooxygenase SsuD/methylene tetrahydromethanopterin reductase-like flavin-dependent oxidoreductase (luciferase family)